MQGVGCDGGRGSNMVTPRVSSQKKKKKRDIKMTAGTNVQYCDTNAEWITVNCWRD